MAAAMVVAVEVILRQAAVMALMVAVVAAVDSKVVIVCLS
jgi:hypothetical protein